jgi:flagellar biosynthesis protein FliQ
VFAALFVLAPFMYEQLRGFTEQLHDRIIMIGTGRGDS